MPGRRLSSCRVARADGVRQGGGLLHIAMSVLTVSAGAVVFSLVRVVLGSRAESVVDVVTWSVVSGAVAGAVAVYLLVDRVADSTERWVAHRTMAYMEKRLQRQDIDLWERVEIERRLSELRRIIAQQE